MADHVSERLVERVREEQGQATASGQGLPFTTICALSPTRTGGSGTSSTADGPNQLWLTDITEHKTAEGKLYLCAVKDVFGNKIVGYSIGSRMKSSLAVRALENAVALRGDVAGCVVQSRPRVAISKPEVPARSDP